MSTTTELLTPRQCARELIALGDQHGDDFTAFAAAASDAVARLLDRPDLLSIGVPRHGNHAAASEFLYYDGELMLTTAVFPPGVTIPVHDHGVWQLLGLYRGEMQHTLYERVDDGAAPGRATLHVTDDRVLTARDVVVMPPPPGDIHGFTALTDDTYILAVVPGDYQPTRRYFDVAKGTYFERAQQGWLSGKA